MHSASEAIEVELLRWCEAKEGAPFVCDPNFIMDNIPLPHSESGGVGGQIESLLAYFQFTRETRCSSHVITQLIAHHCHDGCIGEAEEKGDFQDTPDHQWNVPRQH